ncbi:hypothetical protein SAMN04488576_101307 [Bacillus sp. cl25]|nr:hypothetical protein SAMN04488578_104307 [Bacillus sp. cl96]SEA48144.1 hypothetical protein SAMN04488575_104307 [Bacillus sp. cl115]SHI89902.1 hypothetical protein SAMN04488576_101307 [Bacillus sp. cl25]SME43285.1 hypothetical protein BACERE00188_05020 [Bacillus cereus]SME43644.1 hypothetical protein BACERE00187_05328 [Bacillus cereus]
MNSIQTEQTAANIPGVEVADRVKTARKRKENGIQGR